MDLSMYKQYSLSSSPKERDKYVHKGPIPLPSSTSIIYQSTLSLYHTTAGLLRHAPFPHALVFTDIRIGREFGAHFHPDVSFLRIIHWG